MSLACVALLIALAGSLSLKAAEPTRPIECRWATGAIILDGKADEEAWRGAQVIDNFMGLTAEGVRRPARTVTRARLLWDRENLYYYAEMEDSDIYADVTEKNGTTWNNDVFEMFLKPEVSKPGYYEFQSNALGTLLNVFFPSRASGNFERYRREGAFRYDAKVALHGTLNNWRDHDEGWSVEGVIPWSDFLPTGGRPDLNAEWRFAICRYDYSVAFEGPDQSSHAPFQGHMNFHNYEQWSALRFVGPPRTADTPPFGIEKRIPLTTSKVVGTPEPPPPYRAVRAFPKLKIPFPLNVYHQPGSKSLLAISHVRNFVHTAVVRFEDDPKVEKYETLLEGDWMFWDIAFHPDFARNGYVFITAKGPMSSDSKERVVRLTRYTMQTASPHALDPASSKTIIEWPSDGHDGAAMAFGADGMLYLTSGDGTTDSDKNVVGQDLSVLLSKVLRLDVDHPSADQPYGIPKDNPFVNTPGARPETWCYGMRNPWRMSFDQESGQLWIGQNGQDLWEQIYLPQKGANYGWSVNEGSHPFMQGRALGPSAIVLPLIEHSHLEFRSLTGGLVYRGAKLPELRGTYIYGDYVTGRIWGARHDGKKVTFNDEITDTPFQITGFGTDSQGELLVTDFNTADKGGFYYLEPTPKTVARPNFPKKLSETGLFQSVKGHVVQPGLIPYDVTAPVWHDGAYMERYLALPGDSKIGFTGWRGWNFDDGAVIVQSLALEAEEGNAASRHWVETRLLTRQGGDWQGYSFVWNDEQTEATLVEEAGMDREFEVRVPKSGSTAELIRKQTWHYPSRSECMTCHSRAANYVLGLNTQQMNRDVAYGGVVDNQLRTLDHLGLLTVDWGRGARDSISGTMRWKDKKAEKQINDYMSALEPSPLQGEIKPVSAMVGTPDEYPSMVNPYDEHADLNVRARSYLQANCAQCHIETGGGNSLFNTDFTAELKDTKLIDEKPSHDTFGLPDARIVAAGEPGRSVMFMRIMHRSTGHMPPLGSSTVDVKGVELLRDWMTQVKAPPEPEAEEEDAK